MTTPEDPRPQASGDQERQEGTGAGEPRPAGGPEPALPQESDQLPADGSDQPPAEESEQAPAIRLRPAKEAARASVARVHPVPLADRSGAEPEAAAPPPGPPGPDADRLDGTDASVGGDVAAASAAADQDSNAGAGSRRRRLGRWLVAVALVLLTVVAGFLLFKVRAVQLDDQAREQALTAARQTAINVTSISTKEFATDVARVLDGSTGSFRQDFSARTGQLEQLLKDNDVSAQGRVLEAGVARSDRRTATALLVVDSTVKNKQVPDGRVNTYRMKIDMEKVGDRWLASSLEFVA